MPRCAAVRILLFALLLPVACTSTVQQPPFPGPQAVEDSAAEREPVPFPLTWTRADQPAAETFRINETGPLKLSVEDTILMTLQHNLELRAEQLAPDLSGAFAMLERSEFDPQWSLEATYERNKEFVSGEGADSLEDFEQTRLTAGLQQRLPTGTQLAVEFSQSGERPDDMDEEHSARLGVSLTQALLRGFGSKINLIRVRQAELNTRASAYQLRGFAEQLLADAEIAYWEYVLARREMDIFRESLDLARRQREEVELRIEVGVLADIEAAAARAEEALRVQALIDARSQLNARRLRLLKFISPDPQAFDATELLPQTAPQLETAPIVNLSERLKLAEQSRAELGQARLLLRRNRLETHLTRNGLLPRLDFFLALGQSGYARSFSGSLRAEDEQGTDFSAGVTLSQALGRRGAEAEEQIALLDRGRSRQALENLIQQVHLELRLAVNEAQRARKQIDASRATRIFQEQTLDAERERFEVGSSTSLLVAQAQRDLLAAQIAEIEALVNYRIALVGVYRAEGSLLERRGIQLVSGGYSVL